MSGSWAPYHTKCNLGYLTKIVLSSMEGVLSEFSLSSWLHPSKAVVLQKRKSATSGEYSYVACDVTRM